MLTQMTIPFRSDLKKIKDEAIGRVEKNAHQEWLSAARTVVRDLARRQQYFTADDFWIEIDKLDVQTHDNRAFGAVMREMARERLVTSTGRYVKTQRARRHSSPIAVWRSNTYR